MARQNFSHRSVQSELMDTEIVSFQEFHQCLRQLEFINICTFAYRPTLKWLRRVWQYLPQEQPIFILDAGSGGGDMLRTIWKWSQKHQYKVTLMGVDFNPWSKKSAEEMTPGTFAVSFETADIFSLNLPQQPDFIISALFTHHLTDDELIKFILWMDEQAVYGWFINDLHRHPIAYYFIQCVTRMIPTNRLIRHDAPVSVARAFTASDWYNLLAKAGIPRDRTQITWNFPFRYGVECKK
ncbi:MAG: methyltransferase domain-containing protein [Micavibrio sp.]